MGYTTAVKNMFYFAIYKLFKYEMNKALIITAIFSYYLCV